MELRKLKMIKNIEAISQRNSSISIQDKAEIIKAEAKRTGFTGIRGGDLNIMAELCINELFENRNEFSIFG